MAPDELIATIRYEGIVLQGNDYFLRTILPPIEHSHNQLYQIVGWFDTPTERLSLSREPDSPAEPHDLLSIGTFERATLICSVSGQRDFQKSKGNRRFLDNALSLANYNPDSNSPRSGARNDMRRQTLQTQTIQDSTCSWDALQFPEDPLYLCSFDLILLADQALSRLESTQLDAIRNWVAAGGSLCILPDDKRLTGRHLQFLQKLFERPDDPDFALSITDEGSLLVISSQNDVVVNRRFGLGRVTLLPNVDDISQHLTKEKLGSVVGHLWKVRSNSSVYQGDSWSEANIKTLLQSRGLKITQENGEFLLQRIYGRNQNIQRLQRYQSLDHIAMDFNLNYELQPTGSPLAAACESALMPQGVQMVPSYIIALLLIAYVITIGPIDYFVLGFFRIRKYTWLLFPVVTAGFTVLTVYIAHSYMASSDTGGRMTVVDLTDIGPVRQTDIQMHFYGSQTNMQQESVNSFLVPGQLTQSTDPFAANATQHSLNRNIHYSGRFPQTFQTTQSMRQWEPQLNRSMTFAPKADGIPDIPWDDTSLVTTTEGRQRLKTVLRQFESNDQQVDAVVLNGTSRMPIFGVTGFMFSRTNLDLGRNWVNMDMWQRRSQIPPQNAIASVGLLESSARTGTRDYFSIVSQLSPQGSASMEDLPILDPTDPKQWLLIVAAKKDMHTTVYRRLYNMPSPTKTETAATAPVQEATNE